MAALRITSTSQMYKKLFSLIYESLRLPEIKSMFPIFVNKNQFDSWLVAEHRTRKAHIIRRGCANGDCDIAHLGNPSYWRISECEESHFGQISSLLAVCWLEIKTTFSRVPPGRYLAYWNISLDNFNFYGVWKIGVNSTVREFGDRYHRELSEGPHEVSIATDDEREAFNAVVGNGWQFFVLGVVELDTYADVNAHFLGGNPHWCRGVHYDHIGLVRLPLDWAVRRILLIAVIKEKSNSKCALAKLDMFQLTRITEFL